MGAVVADDEQERTVESNLLEFGNKRFSGIAHNRYCCGGSFGSFLAELDSCILFNGEVSLRGLCKNADVLSLVEALDTELFQHFEHVEIFIARRNSEARQGEFHITRCIGTLLGDYAR